MVSSGRIALRASRYTIAYTNDNPDSGVTAPLYSCEASHTMANKLRVKPRAHVGVMWLRGLIGTGDYLDAKVFENLFSFPPTLPRSFTFINLHLDKANLPKVFEIL